MRLDKDGERKQSRDQRFDGAAAGGRRCAFLITAETGPGVRHICETPEQVAGGHGGAHARVPARSLSVRSKRRRQRRPSTLIPESRK